jgi:hypothetical protein
MVSKRWVLFTPEFYEHGAYTRHVVASSRDKGDMVRLMRRLMRSNGTRHYDLRRF